jgi:hypothetical protein
MQESFLPTSHELLNQDEEEVNGQDEEELNVQDEEDVHVQDEAEVNVQDKEEVNIFVESLCPDLAQLNKVANHSTRDLLKAPINELFQCLDCLKSTGMNEKVTKVVEALVNGVRAKLASATSRKRDIDNCQTVHVNVEESNGGKRRIFASKNS